MFGAAQVEEARSSGMDEAIASFAGEVDVLVNNVGSGLVRTFDDLTDEDWEKTFQLNFMSYVRACRKVLPVTRSRRRGTIVNNGSDLARQPEPVRWITARSSPRSCR